MDVGEIYSVEIPSSNGHEQAGTRPAIVVQASQFETRLPTVLIIPLTSRLTAQTFPGTLTIQPDAENNLNMPSIALAFQLRAIDKRRLKRRIGRLSSALLAQVHQTMKELLQLS